MRINQFLVGIKHIRSVHSLIISGSVNYMMSIMIITSFSIKNHMQIFASGSLMNIKKEKWTGELPDPSPFPDFNQLIER